MGPSPTRCCCWLLDSRLKLTVEPVEKLQRKLIVMHQLNLHELFDTFLAELGDTLPHEVSGGLRRGELPVKNCQGQVKYNLAQISDQPLFVVSRLRLSCLQRGLVFEQALV